MFLVLMPQILFCLRQVGSQNNSENLSLLVAEQGFERIEIVIKVEVEQAKYFGRVRPRECRRKLLRDVAKAVPVRKFANAAGNVMIAQVQHAEAEGRCVADDSRSEACAPRNQLGLAGFGGGKILALHGIAIELGLFAVGLED